MKKDMNTKNNITENSINNLNQIFQTMEGSSFHKHYHILYDLCDNLEKNDLTYLEIGAYAGGSASLVSTNSRVSKVISVDLGNPIEKNISIRNVNKFKHSGCDYYYIEGNSQIRETVQKVSDLTTQVDILFIDGDHSYSGVMTDFENYKDFVIKGGYIVFDDYLDEENSPQVFLAVNDIVQNLDSEQYEVIGSLTYEVFHMLNTELKSSNEFILRKK
jgi:predicted O-methyltransferase YrrM